MPIFAFYHMVSPPFSAQCSISVCFVGARNFMCVFLWLLLLFLLLLLLVVQIQMEYEQQLVSHIFGVDIAADVFIVIVTVSSAVAVAATQKFIHVRCRFDCDVMVIMWVWHAIRFLFGFRFGVRAYLRTPFAGSFCAVRSSHCHTQCSPARVKMRLHTCHCLESACASGCVFAELITTYAQTKCSNTTTKWNSMQCFQFQLKLVLLKHMRTFKQQAHTHA